MVWFKRLLLLVAFVPLLGTKAPTYFWKMDSAFWCQVYHPVTRCSTLSGDTLSRWIHALTDKSAYTGISSEFNYGQNIPANKFLILKGNKRSYNFYITLYRYDKKGLYFIGFTLKDPEMRVRYDANHRYC